MLLFTAALSELSVTSLQQVIVMTHIDLLVNLEQVTWFEGIIWLLAFLLHFNVTALDNLSAILLSEELQIQVFIIGHFGIDFKHFPYTAGTQDMLAFIVHFAS